MKTQRSALLGLVLGLAVFGAACEDKTEVIIPPPADPPIVVTVTPQQLTLEVGQSATLAAAVTGGNATTAKTVTWSTSSAATATVDASGNVNAVAAGVATIIATATADAGAKAAAAVTVIAPPPPAIPSVSIKSITFGATTVPVALNNVFGQIDITLNLDVPTGAKVSALRTYVNNVKVCEQTFSGGAEIGATEEVNEAADVICSVNTAAYTGTVGTDAQATITFPNGPGYKIKAEIVDPTGTITAQIQSADLLFNNPSFIVAQKVAPTHCTTGAPLAGATFWCEGDITANFLPVNFSTNANDAVNSITLTASTGATITDAAAGWSNTLQKASTPGASSIAGVEGVVGLFVTSTTVGGQTGPACINPDPVLNPTGVTCTVVNANTWVLATGGLPSTAFLVDNRAPTITLFDITPGTICVGSASPACYVNGAFAFSVRTGFFAHTDGGVGSPTATFMAGLPGAEVDVTSGADMAESATSQTYVIKATSMDKLDNAVTRWAGTSNVAPTTSATSGATQLFGIDKTNPTQVVTMAPNGSVNMMPFATAGAAYTDAGVGPSGFLANPVSIRIKRITAAGTTCHHPDTGAAVSCTTNSGFVADDGVPVFLQSGGFIATPIDGYFIIDVYVTDQARNVSTTTTLEVLSDVTAPSFTGGIVAPATIAGGSAASFISALADGVDLGSLLPYVGYGNPAVGFLAWPSQAIGTFGSASLATTDAGAVTIGAFIRSIQTTTLPVFDAGTGLWAGGGVPTGTINGATSMTYAIRDMAGHQLRWAIAPWRTFPDDGQCPPAVYPHPPGGQAPTQNCATRQLDISANAAAPVAGIFPQAYGAGAAPAFNCLVAGSNCDLIGLNAAGLALGPPPANWGNWLMQDPSAALICNDVASANCPTLGSNKTMTTLTATLTGPVSVFVSPFTEVQFRFMDPAGGPDMYIGSAGSPSITDNTVTSTRTITYTLVWDASNPKVRPAGLGTAYTVYAVGRNATGDALLTSVFPAGSYNTVTVEGN